MLTIRLVKQYFRKSNLHLITVSFLLLPLVWCCPIVAISNWSVCLSYKHTLKHKHTHKHTVLYQCWERSQTKVISNQNQNHRDFKSKSKIISLKVISNQNQKSPISKWTERNTVLQIFGNFFSDEIWHGTELTEYYQHVYHIVFFENITV